MADLTEALSKIRPHTSSNLAHQKAPATLLHALEATLDEQGAERTPTAYYAALLTTLDGTVQKEKQSGLKLGEGDLLPAELYLLALVAPFAPAPVVRSNLNTLLNLTAPLFPALHPHPPALRSQLGIYGSIFVSLDRNQLDLPAVRQSFASILQLCLDPRPKVRKRAGEVVGDVLASPPAPLASHPYSVRVAEWARSTIADANANAIPRGKGKQDMESAEIAIHLLQLLKVIARRLPSSSLPALVPHLLSLPRLGNPFLSQSAYALLTSLLTSPTDDDESSTDNVSTEIPAILKAVLSSLPSRTDTTTAPAWLALLGTALTAADTQLRTNEFAKVWKAAWAFLDANDAPVRRAAASALSVLTQCITPDLVAPSLTESDEPKSALGKIIQTISKSLDALSFARAMPELLSVLSALITSLRVYPAAAEKLLLPIVVRVGALRVQNGFEHKESADAVLGAAMSAMGPHILLQSDALPLNIEPSDRAAGRSPRAYLLPLLTSPHPSPLSHFLSYFVPLSERMFNYQQEAEDAGRSAEAKMWGVLVAQIWAGLPAYCFAPGDLEGAMTPGFGQMLSGVMYGQPELRSPVLRALRTLVESNVALAKGDEEYAKKYPVLRNKDAKLGTKNVEFLRAQADSWLAVLFNVFGSVGRESRGMVGEVVSAWAGIASDKSIAQAHAKVLSLFKTSLTTPTRSFGPNTENQTSMTQDILIILLPYLSTSDASSLFELILQPAVLAHSDNGVQKRGYKILAKLVEGKGEAVIGEGGVEGLLKKLDGVVEGLNPAAKKDRMYLYTNLLPLIPPSSLHIIPNLIPEAVLGTKEPSEKARTAAFELVVAMGRKMAEGGVIKHSLISGAGGEYGDEEMQEGEEEGGKGEAKASVEEYLTMLAGGLAGGSPHMISATITALARVVFEFHDDISSNMQTELLTTLLVFLPSTNREIVKSALGFLKLAISHSFPKPIITPHLPQLVPALLARAHDHKNHFKVKVRHILERLIRRFGYEDVRKAAEDGGVAGGGEGLKVLGNIKKRKDRAKRKRAAVEEAGEGESDGEEKEGKGGKAGDAFEDVLYGSESEIEDSDEEEGGGAKKGRDGRGGQTQQGKSGKREFGARLRGDDEQPMDLLSGAASRVTNAQQKRRKPGQDASHFTTDTDGRMVIDDSASSADERAAGEDVAGTAYREQMTSADGFTRDSRGRVKFNKDTKKRRRENADEDVDMDLGDATSKGRGTGERPAKRRSDQGLGREFKAKKAGGDVKKGGVDPYAYVPLGQAAKKGNGGKKARSGIAKRA
ncbi:NUC173-domain-containing protein [Peniophora sp. CONT]|nr:NUC173-domain-containing protein [Peniophora sp. CONT]